MLCRQRAKCFIPQECEIIAAREFIQPIVHRANDNMHAKSSVAQEICDAFVLESHWSIRIAPGHLYIERNETIAWIAHEQNDFRPTEFLFRHQIFAANSVPKITFGAVFE